MATDKERFHVTGPFRLTYFNWDNPYHQRAIAASLVQGVNVLEKDRKGKRAGPYALAPPWWTSFHFQLPRPLVDDVDHSIFGAIYEYKPPSSSSMGKKSPRRYVIAFRGSAFKEDSFCRDIDLDTQIVLNRLHLSSRAKIAIEAVRNVVATVGASNVWLAGHSQGSAMAMLTGKTMAKTGIFIKSFLFNPPFPSAPIETIIKDQNLKHGLRVVGTVVKAGLAIAMNRNHHSNKSTVSFDQFAALSDWVPSLFVNQYDIICSEYVGYFEHRKNMEESGAGSIANLAAQTSIRSLLMNAIGTESEPLYLIPSAFLTVNSTPSRDFQKNHGIHQWWDPNVRLKSQLYQY